MTTSESRAANPPESEDEVGSNHRRYERFAVNLKATLIQGRKAIQGHVVDVSFTGLFFTTSSPPPLRDLVKIDLDMPSGGTTRLLGMAVHIVPPHAAGPRRPGVGVQLFGIGPEVRAEWDRFVGGVRSAHLKAAESGEAPSPSSTGPLGELEPETETQTHTDEDTVQTEPASNLVPVSDVAPVDAPGPFQTDGRRATATPMPEPQPEGEPEPEQKLAPEPTREPERPSSDGVFPLPTTDELDAAFGRLRVDTAENDASAESEPTDNPVELKLGSTGTPALGSETSAKEGPGDVAPGPNDDPSLENLFEVAKPELRVRVGKLEDVEPLRQRQTRHEQLFFRTEVHMEPGTEIQVRVLLPDDTTVFVAEGRVIESIRTGDPRGLSILLDEEDVAPSEDIYITIDLDRDWLDSPS